MCAAKRGLGRGLDALLQGFGEEAEAPEIVLVPLSKIRANPSQPRRDFDEDALNELSESIKKSGVLQPVLVRPVDERDFMYELVAGERRWRASHIAEIGDIPAIIKDLDDQESLAIALIENLQREDLNPIEEALGIRHLQEEFGLTQEELAEKVGKSRPAIANTLRLTQLPYEVQKDIRTGAMSAGHGRALLSITDSQAQDELRTRILERNLSVREAEAMASYWKRVGMLPEGQGPRPAARGKKAKAALLPQFESVQTGIVDAIGAKVAMKGDMNKGSITLKYTSQTELQAILDAFGVDLPQA